MRSWPTSQLGAEGEGEVDKQDSSQFSCLVAVGRVHNSSSPQLNGEVKVKPTEFITRYAMDGKFTFVDQRYTCVLAAECYLSFLKTRITFIHKMLNDEQSILREESWV